MSEEGDGQLHRRCEQRNGNLNAPKGSRRHARVTGEPVARIAPLGPRLSPPSHRGRTANPADNEGVRGVLRGLTRRAAREGRTPRQAAALMEEGLAAIRETAQLRRTGPGGRTERASKAPAAVRWTSHLCRSCGTPCLGAHVGRRGVFGDGSARVHRPPLQERPGRQRGHPVSRGEPPRAELRAIHRQDAAPKAQVFGPRSGRAVSNRIAAAAKAAGLTGPLLGTLTPGSDSRPGETTTG